MFLFFLMNLYTIIWFSPLFCQGTQEIRHFWLEISFLLKTETLLRNRSQTKDTRNLFTDQDTNSLASLFFFFLINSSNTKGLQKVLGKMRFKGRFIIMQNFLKLTNSNFKIHIFYEPLVVLKASIYDMSLAWLLISLKKKIIKKKEPVIFILFKAEMK